MPEIYRLHPVAVHFPIALLLTGLAAGWLSTWRGRPDWLAEAVSWLLWLGTASAWAALGLGLLAERAAPHVPPAWEALATHESLAWWTVGSFTALSLWRRRLGRSWERGLMAAWTLAAGVLLATAYYGGELVFKFGMGVTR